MPIAAWLGAPVSRSRFIEPTKRDALTKGGGDLAAQLVVVEPQLLQRIPAAEARGDRPLDRVAAQREGGHGLAKLLQHAGPVGKAAARTGALDGHLLEASALAFAAERLEHVAHLPINECR